MIPRIIRASNLNREVQNQSTAEPEVETQSQPIDNSLELSQNVNIEQENKKKIIPHAIRHILKKKR